MSFELGDHIHLAQSFAGWRAERRDSGVEFDHRQTAIWFEQPVDFPDEWGFFRDFMQDCSDQRQICRAVWNRKNVALDLVQGDIFQRLGLSFDLDGFQHDGIDIQGIDFL